MFGNSPRALLFLTLLSCCAAGPAAAQRGAADLRQSRQPYYDPLISIDEKIPTARRRAIQAKYDFVLKLLNSPPYGALTAQQVVVISKVNVISIYDGPSTYNATDTRNRVFKESADTVMSQTPGWLATVIAHEGTHIKLFEEGGACKAAGREAEKAGLTAQLELAYKTGLQPHYFKYLNDLLRDPITYHQTQTPGGTKMIIDSDYTTLPSDYNVMQLDDVSVKRGDGVFVCAEGEMLFGGIAGRGGPDGLYNPSEQYQTPFYSFAPRFNHGAVIARINPTPDQRPGQWDYWVYVGSSKAHKGFTAPFDGVLEVAYNDRDYSNNDGEFTFRVMVVRREK